MLTGLIFIILFFAFYIGFRRGFLRELVYLFGYIISFNISWYLYPKITAVVSMWIPYPTASLNQKMAMYSTNDLGSVYYAGISFVIIFLIGWLLTRFIGALAKKLTTVFGKFPLWRTGNKLLGGIVTFMTTYVFLVVILTIISVIPIPAIQQQLDNSSFIREMIIDTPVISKQIQDNWFSS